LHSLWGVWGKCLAPICNLSNCWRDFESFGFMRWDEIWLNHKLWVLIVLLICYLLLPIKCHLLNRVGDVQQCGAFEKSLSMKLWDEIVEVASTIYQCVATFLNQWQWVRFNDTQRYDDHNLSNLVKWRKPSISNVLDQLETFKM
jgi:hypothetical protein